MTKPRTLPLALAVPVASGSDPDVIEIEDCTEVYGGDDDFIVEFPEIDTPCDRSPSGQCEYSWRDDFHACIHCRKPSGLDE